MCLHSTLDFTRKVNILFYYFFTFYSSNINILWHKDEMYLVSSYSTKLMKMISSLYKFMSGNLINVVFLKKFFLIIACPIKWKEVANSLIK